MPNVDSCEIINLPRIHDPRGNLSVIESGTIPFSIARVFYLYDVPGGAERGGHAHKKLQQFLVAMSGSFDVVLNDGRHERRVHLNRAYQGLYLPPMIWAHQENFSGNSVCMVVASERYDESDYHRDFDQYVSAAVSA